MWVGKKIVWRLIWPQPCFMTMLKNTNNVLSEGLKSTEAVRNYLELLLSAVIKNTLATSFVDHGSLTSLVMKAA